MVDYGKRLGIEVFPSLELLGHMENILMLPEFRKYSEWHRPSEGCLDVSNEEAKNFAYELLEETVEFFKDAEYIHIGGDETWALGRGKSLNKTWKFEGTKLYEEHYKKLIEIVKEREKTDSLGRHDHWHIPYRGGKNCMVKAFRKRALERLFDSELELSPIRCRVF